MYEFLHGPVEHGCVSEKGRLVLFDGAFGCYCRRQRIRRVGSALRLHLSYAFANPIYPKYCGATDKPPMDKARRFNPRWFSIRQAPRDRASGAPLVAMPVAIKLLFRARPVRSRLLSTARYVPPARETISWAYSTRPFDIPRLPDPKLVIEGR